MKGAKGGKRDQKVSKLYSAWNKREIEEELEAIQSHRRQDGLNLNTTESGINEIDDLSVDEKSLGTINKDISIQEKNPIHIQKTKIEFDLIKEKDIQKQIEEKSMEQEQKIPIAEKENMQFQEQDELQEIEPNSLTTIDTLIPEQEIKPSIEQKQEEVKQEEEKQESSSKAIEFSSDKVDFFQQKEEYTYETKLENEILLELEKMLKEDYYEIKDLEYQLKVLTQKEEDAVLQEEIERVKEELEALLDKFDIIKKKYEELKNSADFTDVNLFDNNYLSNLINNYKKEVQDNIVIDDLIKRVKETEDYIGIIEKIVYVEKEKEDLGDKVEEKKEEFEERDTSFEKLEDQFNNIDKINSEIESFQNSLNGILKDITQKIDNMGKIYEKTETYSRIVPDINRLFQAMAQFMASTMIPRTKAGNVLRAGLIINGIQQLRQAFKIERKTETKQVTEFVNYEKDILKNMTNMDDFVRKLNDASNGIKEMKQTFKEELLDYVDSIPEFKELMENIENVEKELEEKKYYLNKYNKDMKRELERNNAKVYVYKNS